MITSKILVFISKILLGINSRESVPLDRSKQKIYFANHSSHVDTIAIVAALPSKYRKVTKPVAAADYWGKTPLLKYISTKGLNCILINRKPKASDPDVLSPIYEALDKGNSIIIFPEGTRGDSPLPSDFKSGIYHLAQKYPDIDLIPVYLDNVYRCMPKGKFIPLPLICSVRFGAPLERIISEDKKDFLIRAQNAVIGLSS